MEDVLSRFKADARAIRGWVRVVSTATEISPKTLRAWVYGETKDPRASGYRKLVQFYADRDNPPGDA